MEKEEMCLCGHPGSHHNNGDSCDMIGCGCKEFRLYEKFEFRDEPVYRFEFKIVDANRYEDIISDSTFLSKIDVDGSCESVDMQVGSMLRAFHKKIRERYEAENYQEEE